MFIIKSPAFRKMNCKLDHATLNINNKKIQGNPKSIKQ